MPINITKANVKHSLKGGAGSVFVFWYFRPMFCHSLQKMIFCLQGITPGFEQGKHKLKVFSLPSP